MKLKDYLESLQKSPSTWAKEVGISQPVITRFINGQRGLSLRTALKIQFLTTGMVRVDELIGE